MRSSHDVCENVVCTVAEQLSRRTRDLNTNDANVPRITGDILADI